MAYHHPHHLLLVFLAIVATATPSIAIFHFDFRFDTDGPFSGGRLSRRDMWRRAALESKARHATTSARLAKALSKPCDGTGSATADISGADVTVTPFTHQGHVLSVGIGTPPQASKVVLDMGSDLLWSQCSLVGPSVAQEEPVYDPSRSPTFSLLPCNSTPCAEGAFTSKSCTDRRCQYENDYGVLTAGGVLATETFTFGSHHEVAVNLTFGCGKLTNGTIAGASGILGLSPGPLSLLKQLSIPKFSYCLTPFADRKTSPVMFGAMADLAKYKTTGKIQTVPLLKNPVEDLYYYVPMVGISLGTKKLDVSAESLELQADGTGGTAVDSATTLAYLVPPAFEALKQAVVEAVKLPAANKTVDDYPMCFVLPKGMTMDGVEVPQLVLHFDGGAEMVLSRDNYFQEPSPGMMCLAVVPSPFEGAPSVIGNVQQQNMHVLYDLEKRTFSYAPTQCDKL
ncbi:unnamed protein product [Urochloa decumbens]|uniref:Peptidase A1 domain-containing protein n=1 Tax=Urochloa decumbens TaxID=240449 RepID=A0ABC9BSG6_9POAL